ncbi:ExeM/NucH family extracellular endonuclease [Aestuariimicrobium sp. T2.26MG-19.2B]|uniref:ExeM/NucH family extracellular endonuclease n=1 Tax=Aestuariimicrobium sp. T2.26MG-19.2B TaxID=3040679 RepID=UPI0024777C0F|nr:ExeM/NucH family extracellular endonuclease [Aestuariimicrobium sp. T2.26MG-19.2B]CAI9398912.1 hypothetical protein AESSP_00087 [Aestuariimicrobium sp. T2.26MG-19.2B]
MQPSARAGVGLVLFATALVGVIQAVPARAAADHLIINEAHLRGGSSNQPYTHKFVEILNPTGSPVVLDGLTLQYRSATGTSNATTVVPLTGTLASGDLHVVQGGSNGTTGTALPAGVVDQVASGLNPSGTTGTIYLVQGSSATLPDASSVVDKLGYGTSNSPEGTAATYTGANSDPGALARTTTDDTGNNAADFAFTTDITPGAANPGQSADGGAPSTPPTSTPPAQSRTIAEIQGTTDTSPLVGRQVTTRGVVTAVYPTGGFNGFYLQAPGSGGVPKTASDASDGVFVYGRTGVSVGNCLDVSGTVVEYGGLTELSGVTTTAVDDCAPVAVTGLATLPVTDADKEAYEGMLVQPQGTYTITNNHAANQYGQLDLAVGDEPLYTPTDKVPHTEAAAYEAQQVRKLITLDDGSSWNLLTNSTAKNSPLAYLSGATPMRTGSHVSFTGPVILDHRFQWNYQPTRQVVGAEVDFLASENDRPTSVPAVGGDVKLATFNVLNYFTDLGQDEAGCKAYTDRSGTPVGTNGCQVRGAYTPAAFADQQAKIVSAVNGLDADVVALMEIENSANFGHDRDQTLANLVDALNAADPGKGWRYVPTSPAQVPTGEDNIRLAFIYRAGTVAPVDGSVILSDPAFANARQPLGQKFEVRGTKTSFVAVANHFKSKGSGADDGTGQGLSNPSRKAQATALTSWVGQVFADQPVFLLGDFNAYSKEEPVQIIESAGFSNVVTSDDTTYQFGGRLGSLDHVFGNDRARQLVSSGAVWNINGDESVAFQYSRRNYNVTDLYAADPFASSDHDPAVVGIVAVKVVDVAIKGNRVGVETAGLPLGATVTVSAVLDDGSTRTFTATVTGSALSFKAPSVKSATVEVTSGGHVVGSGSALK